MATAIARSVPLASTPPGASSATMARSGTMARSSSSRIATIRWPFGVESARRSSSNCMTMAVEVSTKPVPATKGTVTENPRPIPTRVRAAMQAPT